MGEGGPLAGEGVGGVEKGLSVDEGSWDRHQTQAQKNTRTGWWKKGGRGKNKTYDTGTPLNTSKQH